MKRILIASAILTTLLFSLGCNEEQNDMAKAQDCLDKVDQSAPTQAEACLQYIEKYDSQQAKILKCSIWMTSGGLVENKIVNAYNALKTSSVANKSAAYMTYLALDVSTVNEGFDKASRANEQCQASGVSGLQYLSSVILAGSSFRKTMASASITIDVNDPASVDAAVNSLLTKCAPSAGTPIDASCSETLATLGTTTMVLSDQYCQNASASQDVCSSINAAVSQTGGDPDKTGRALYCFLRGVNYNAATNECQ